MSVPVINGGTLQGLCLHLEAARKKPHM